MFLHLHNSLRMKQSSEAENLRPPFDIQLPRSYIWASCSFNGQVSGHGINISLILCSKKYLVAAMFIDELKPCMPYFVADFSFINKNNTLREHSAVVFHTGFRSAILSVDTYSSGPSQNSATKQLRVLLPAIISPLMP